LFTKEYEKKRTGESPADFSNYFFQYGKKIWATSTDERIKFMTKKRLSFLEKRIDNSVKNFYTMGKSLREIRDGRLYKIALFNRFEQYTKNRWDMGKSKAYRLINASIAIDNVSHIGETLPQNEAQARALIPFKRSVQRKIWGDFLKSGITLTALNIHNFAASYEETKKTKKLDETHIISEAYKKAVLLMIEQIRVAQNKRWQDTSRDAALMWNQVMRERILSPSSFPSEGKNGQ